MTIVISLCYPRLAAKTYSVEARLCHSHLCAGLAMETFFTATSRDWPRLLQLSSSPHLRRSKAINWFFPRSALKFFSNLSFMPPLFSWASLVASLVTALPCTLGRPLLKNKKPLNFLPAKRDQSELKMHKNNIRFPTHLTLSLTPPWTLTLQATLSTFFRSSGFTVSSGLGSWPFSALWRHR